MNGLRVFFTLVRWDLLRELRRRETVLNMTLFAVLVLFLIHLGTAPLFQRFTNAPGGGEFLKTVPFRLGAVLFWITVLFAGSVGLTQSFAAERESGSLAGILASPVDLGVFYLAKVAATWLYVMVMELVLLAGFVILFNFDHFEALGPQLLCLSFFTLGYIAVGVILAAMTTALRGGGEVVLRLLLFPLLLPMIYLTLGVEEATFGYNVAGGQLGPSMSLGTYLTLVGAFDVIYLTAGFAVFPRVFEE